MNIGSVLRVKKDLFDHLSAYVGNGMVLQNHPERGEEIVTIYEFSGGREITILVHGTPDEFAFMRRVQQIMANPSAYSVFYNCEHTVSKARTGVAESPQLALWACGGLAVCTLTYIVLKRSR